VAPLAKFIVHSSEKNCGKLCGFKVNISEILGVNTILHVLKVHYCVCNSLPPIPIIIEYIPDTNKKRLNYGISQVFM